MPVIPPDAIEQLKDLPVVVAVLLIAMAAILGVVWIGSRLLQLTETSRKEERQSRDGVFLTVIENQREMDRAIGKQLAEVVRTSNEAVAKSLDGLADAIRDSGTATLTLIQGVMDKVDGISDKVDEAMNANTDAIRVSNHQIATMARDVDEILRRNHDDEPDKKARR